MLWKNRILREKSKRNCDDANKLMIQTIRIFIDLPCVGFFSANSFIRRPTAIFLSHIRFPSIFQIFFVDIIHRMKRQKRMDEVEMRKSETNQAHIVSTSPRASCAWLKRFSFSVRFSLIFSRIMLYRLAASKWFKSHSAPKPYKPAFSSHLVQCFNWKSCSHMKGKYLCRDSIEEEKIETCK